MCRAGTEGSSSVDIVIVGLISLIVGFVGGVFFARAITVKGRPVEPARSSGKVGGRGVWLGLSDESNSGSPSRLKVLGSRV